MLERLGECPHGKFRMQELADAVHSTQSTVSRVVARLEDEGLACRAMCPDDRRGIFASLTEAGERPPRRGDADVPPRDRGDARRGRPEPRLALLGREADVARVREPVAHDRGRGRVAAEAEDAARLAPWL